MKKMSNLEKGKQEKVQFEEKRDPKKKELSLGLNEIKKREKLES